MKQRKRIEHMYEPLDENKDYRKPGVAIPALHGTVSDCEAVKDALLTLVAQRKLDATDIAIIQARDCSPMPTVRQVAETVGIPRSTVFVRLDKIRSMLTAFSP